MLNRYVLLDLETVPSADCERWLSPFEPDKRLSDPVKIANDVAHKRAAQLAEAGLDADLCQIVLVSYQTDSLDTPHATLILDEKAEATALELVWQLVSQTRPMVGYGLSWFDAGVLVRRSQLLGVPVPAAMYQQGKYRHPMIVELADYLTLNGMIDQKKGRGLDYHCQRFGIQVADTVTGKDIAGLWATNDYHLIESHGLADLARIRALAERLGVIQPVPSHAEVA